MKEPFIIEINGTNQLINVSCEAEARYISKKVNGKIKGAFSVEDYKIINILNTKKMKKMDILQVGRMLAIIGGILLSLAIVLLMFHGFLVKNQEKEEQKIEDAFVSDVYGFYKDGKWIKYEELVVGEKELVNNKHGSGNVGVGTEAVKSCSYKPIKLEEWQIIQIKDAKEKGFAGIEMTINNNQTYISFHNTSNQSQ